MFSAVLLRLSMGKRVPVIASVRDLPPPDFKGWERKICLHGSIGTAGLSTFFARLSPLKNPASVCVDVLSTSTQRSRPVARDR